MTQPDSMPPGMTLNGKPVQTARSDAYAKVDDAYKALAEARSRYWRESGPLRDMDEAILDALGATISAVRAAIDIRGTD